MMKCDALSAPSTSMEPANTWGWLAMTATGWPPSRASAVTTDFPKSGCTSNHDDWSTTTSMTSRTSYTRLPSRGTMSRISSTRRGAVSSCV